MSYKSSELGRKSYNPYKLFAAIIYCFAKHKGTLRNIEEMCRYDSRIWYILSQERPSYKTIHEFIDMVIRPNYYRIFSLITTTIIRELNIDISDQYLDGTKIEANANKYKFVFKPRKHRINLDRKIRILLKELNIGYQEEDCLVMSLELQIALNTFSEIKNIDIKTVPTGKGSKPTREQKLLKYGYELLSKLLEYEEREIICGPNRNSYYKTDNDATAMALKADYYSGHGSNMKAAYNVQFLVSSGFVTFFGVYQDRSDYYTLIPLLEKYEMYCGDYPRNLCADSGYGVFTNYEYLNRHNIGNYIKYLNWSGESQGKNPQRFFLNEKENGFVCLNGVKGRVIDFDSSHHQRKKKSKLYYFEGCLDCPYEYRCRDKIKDRTTDFRKFELSLKEEIYHKQVRENLLSMKGIEIRVNRSIQAEGAFGELKQNMGYVRLRRRGLEKVSTEIMMMALAINIRKMFAVYGKKHIESSYWKTKEDTEIQSFPEVKPKKKG
ncbi:MAG: transposase [Erysipelotrichaceae bacterium]|nr:transposase [Erysipelotrichaceae bacterium]